MSLEIVTITEKAKTQIEHIIGSDSSYQEKGVRLGVVGGGCSGLSYKIDFDSKKEKDYVLEFNDFHVFVDPKSAIYLKGIELDYKDGLTGKGFVFNNPNAKNTCGCGESFSV